MLHSLQGAVVKWAWRLPRGPSLPTFPTNMKAQLSCRVHLASLDKDKSDGNENTLANDVTEKEKINAAPNEEAAAGGSEKVPIRSEDKSLDTKS